MIFLLMVYLVQKFEKLSRGYFVEKLPAHILSKKCENSKKNPQ